MNKITKKQRREKYLARQLSFGGNGIYETPRTVTIRGDVFDKIVEKSWNGGWRARAKHGAIHKDRSPDSTLLGYGQPNPEIKCACGCGNTRPQFDSQNRPHTFIKGHHRRNIAV